MRLSQSFGWIMRTAAARLLRRLLPSWGVKQKPTMRVSVGIVSVLRGMTV